MRTAGLVAATVHGRMKTTVIVKAKSLLSYYKDSATKVRDVAIPVWIRDTARPSDWSSITEQDWIKSGADMWTSITEIRRSDLKKHTPKIRKYDTVASRGHDYEWLACGFIPKSCVEQIMPWDGKKLHTVQDTRIVRSIGSPDPWIFDYNIDMWRLDARLYRTACFLSVYRAIKSAANAMLTRKSGEPPAKRQRTSKQALKKTKKAEKTLIDQNPYAEDGPSSAANDADGPCCTSCGQKKAAFRLEDEVSGPLAFLDLASTTKPSVSTPEW
jgi:hypothetical protein